MPWLDKDSPHVILAKNKRRDHHRAVCLRKERGAPNNLFVPSYGQIVAWGQVGSSVSFVIIEV